MAINMKFIVLLSTIFMMTNGHCGPVKPQEAQIRIRTTFNIKNSFCNIKTNGVKGLNNRKSAFYGSGDGISSTNSLLFLENGTNEISVEIGSLDWFSKDTSDKEQKGKFSPTSSCNTKLIRFDEKENVTLASISVKINNLGLPEGINADSKIIPGKKYSLNKVYLDILMKIISKKCFSQKAWNFMNSNKKLS